MKKLNDFFQADKYAMDTTGIIIDEAGDGYAVCSLHPEERHANADGVVQGGALYTLADFCFAVAANNRVIIEKGQPNTVTLSANITYLRPAKLGEKLRAVAKCIRSGRRACCYEIIITAENNRDNAVSIITVSGMTTR